MTPLLNQKFKATIDRTGCTRTIPSSFWHHAGGSWTLRWLWALHRPKWRRKILSSDRKREGWGDRRYVYTGTSGGEVSENTTRRRRASAGSETSAPRPARAWAAARPAKQSRCAAPAVKALIWVDSARMAGPRLGRLRAGALRWKPRWCSRASASSWLRPPASRSSLASIGTVDRRCQTGLTQVRNVSLEAGGEDKTFQGRSLQSKSNRASKPKVRVTGPEWCVVCDVGPCRVLLRGYWEDGEEAPKPNSPATPVPCRRRAIAR